MPKTSVLLLAMFSLGFGGLCRGGETTVVATGDWSKPVGDDRGYAVRGRLVLAENPLGRMPARWSCSWNCKTPARRSAAGCGFSRDG